MDSLNRRPPKARCSAVCGTRAWAATEDLLLVAGGQTEALNVACYRLRGEPRMVTGVERLINSHVVHAELDYRRD